MKTLVKIATIGFFVLGTQCSRHTHDYEVSMNEALYLAIGSKSPNFQSLQEGGLGALEVGGGDWGKIEVLIDGESVEVVEGGFFIGPILNRSRARGRAIKLSGESDSLLYYGLQLIEFNGLEPVSSKVVKLGTLAAGQIDYTIDLGEAEE